jgi:hypothetical protein
MSQNTVVSLHLTTFFACTLIQNSKKNQQYSQKGPSDGGAK